MKSNNPDNNIGILHDSFSKHGEKVAIYYYATKKGQLRTKTDNKWYGYISKTTELLNKVNTRSTTKGATISLTNGLEPTKKWKLLPLTEAELQSSEALVLENEFPHCTIFEGQDSSSDHHCPNDTFPYNHPWSSYWDSSEAIKLF